MFKLTPTNTKFYDHFDRASDVLVRAAQGFVDYLDNFGDSQAQAEKMKRLEHEADEITHATMALLDKSFITPIERSDIRRLIMSLDDVLDYLDDATSRIALYEIPEVLPDVRKLAAVLLAATKEVQLVVHRIRNLRKRHEILQHCIEIHRLEDEGDSIHHDALARLFKSGLDAFMVIKWKDIIEDIETSLDHCQDVANVVEGIVLENA